MRDFLARYGHRAVAEIDLGMPRWSEEPDHILGMISNYLRVEDPEQAPDRQFRRAAEHAEDRIRSLVERAAAHGAGGGPGCWSCACARSGSCPACANCPSSTS